jgi:hypothetical protein
MRRPVLSCLALLLLFVSSSASAEGVLRITRDGLGNVSAWNWPAGIWYVAAVLLDAEGDAVGELSEGFQVILTGATFPSSVEVEMEATASVGDRIRVFRASSPLAPGATGVEFADFLCDDGGGVAALCDVASPSGVDGGTGYLKNGAFTGVGAIPGGAAGLAAITRAGLGNVPDWNWPVGTWYVRGVLLNEHGHAVGQLSEGFSVALTGTTFPSSVDAEVFGTAPAGARIRVFRSLEPIAPGDVGVAFADFLCDDGDGGTQAVCDPLSGASPVGGTGYLREIDFAAVGAVPNGSLGVAAITRNGLGNVPSWNWPAGTWYVTAVLMNAAGEALNIPLPGFQVTLSGTTFPSSVEVQVFANATPSQYLRVFRSQGPILPGDTGVEYADFPCDAGPGVESWCDALTGASLIGDTGYLREIDFTATGTVPVTAVAVAETPARTAPRLDAWPNPFNPRVTLRYRLAGEGRTALRIYDAQGRLVRVLFEGPAPAGDHVIVWNGTTGDGRRVASGVYFVQIVGPGGSAAAKVALIR